MSVVCPNGHTSEADDYCDVCGSPIDADAQPAASGMPPAGPGAAGEAESAAGTASRSSLDLGPPPTGAPAPAEAAAPSAPTAPATLECPNCGTENPDGALFCEACGYDFTTGALPREASSAAGSTTDGAAEPAARAAPRTAPGAAEPASSVDTGSPSGQASPGTPGGSAPFDWLAEVWIDPDWYQTQEAEDPCPSPGLPTIVPLRRRSVLLGRVSASKNTHPEIDLSTDPGVSRRHAQLTSDGARWFVEDLGSSNGTFVGPASGPLPEQPITVGPKTELDDDDRLYVGAWTRVVVRRATPDEIETYG